MGACIPEGPPGGEFFHHKNIFIKLSIDNDNNKNLKLLVTNVIYYCNDKLLLEH